MKPLLYTLLIGGLGLSLALGANAQQIFREYQGGTGEDTYTTGDVLIATSTNNLDRLPIGSNGQVLKVDNGKPAWGTDNSGGGAGLWSTTTAETAIYPSDTTDVVIIGANSTSTDGIFEVNGNSALEGDLALTGTVTSGTWNGGVIDFSDYTNATAGAGITFTDDAISADLGDSIDISDETNLTVVATGIELSGDDIALTTGYKIPLSASTTDWENFKDTPSTEITAGTGLSWTSNTLDAEVQSSDLHDSVTLSGTPNYITLSGQDITRNKLDLPDDINTFTEAELENAVSDATNIFTNNDGALDDDDLTDDDLDALQNVAAITEQSQDLFYYDGSNWDRFGIGSDGQVLKVSSGNLVWGADETGGTSGGLGTTTPWTTGDLTQVVDDGTVRSKSTSTPTIGSGLSYTGTFGNVIGGASGTLTADLGTEIEFSEIASSAIITEAESIASNDNDTTWPTSAAVKDYADTNDDDTTYSAGTALSLSGTTFNFDQTLSQSGASQITGATDINFTGTNDATVTVTDDTDGTATIDVDVTDTDTTYTAGGTLLNLSGTTFSLNEGTLTNGNFCTFNSTGDQLECNTSGSLSDDDLTDDSISTLSDVSSLTNGTVLTREGGNVVSSSTLSTGVLDSTVIVEGENISLLNNDSGYITDANDAVDGSELDNLFSSNGFLKRTSANTYSADSVVDFSDETNATAGTGITFSGDEITADLGSTIVTGDITNGTILEEDLDATNAPSDNQILSFDNTSGGFTWVDDQTGHEERIISTTIASTSAEWVDGGSLPAGSDKDGFTLTEYRCWVEGGTSVVVNLSDGTNSTETITCGTNVTSDTDVATSDTFNADEKVYLDIGTISGDVGYLHFEAYGTVTR